MTEDASTVLFTTFLVSNKRCRVYFRKKVLIWEKEDLPYARQAIPVDDIVAVHCGAGNSRNHARSRTNGLSDMSSTFQGGPESHKSLVVHYAKPEKKNKWSIAKITFHHSDPRQVASWLLTLENALKALNRPKSFLVFVNPFCGKRKGIGIFKRHVKPILDLAKVDANVIATEHREHAKEVILSADMEKYDGVLAVGGDGTLSEVVNALVMRSLRDTNQDADDYDSAIPDIRTPVAVIPGGSTDCVAYCLNGTRDRRTAAIFAVLGTQKGFDVCSVHSSKGLCRFFLSVLACGFLGDVLEESEKHRWMGPGRYKYAGFLKMLKNRRYYCEVGMTLTPRTTGLATKCFRYCSVCEAEGPPGAAGAAGAATATPKTRYQEENLSSIKRNLNLFRWVDEEPKKLTVRGKFFMVSCANISCACQKSPNGLAPFGHLGDGCVDVLLFRPERLSDVIKLLLQAGSKKESAAVPDLPFVDAYKATEINIRVLDEDGEGADGSGTGKSRRSNVWNCDGELMTEPSVRIKNYRQLVRMFSRRQQQGAAETTSCFGSCRICSKSIV